MAQIATAPSARLQAATPAFTELIAASNIIIGETLMAKGLGR